MAEVKGGNISSSWVASGDMSANQFRFVNNVGLNSNDLKVFVATSGQGFTVGVQQNKPKNNEHCAVVNGGWTKLYLAGSLGAQNEIMPGIGGGATIATSQFSAGWIPCAGNSGEVVSAYIQIRKVGL